MTAERWRLVQQCFKSIRVEGSQRMSSSMLLRRRLRTAQRNRFAIHPLRKRRSPDRCAERNGRIPADSDRMVGRRLGRLSH